MYKKIVFGALFAVLATTSVAQEKIAVVNFQAAILGSEYGQAELKKLEDSSEFSALVTEFEGLRADLQALESNAQANASKWDEDEVAEFTRQRQFLQADLETNGKKIQSDQQTAIQAIYQVMDQPAQLALKELIEEESVTLLLNEEAVRFATSLHDLTEKLAQKLNN